MQNGSSKSFHEKKLCLKKYYHLKKLLRTLCSDKKNPRKPPTLGINSFHVETNTKTIIISVKGTPIFLKALDLFL